MTVNRDDIAREVCSRLHDLPDLSFRHCRRVVDTVFTVMAEKIAAGEEVSVTGFGRFRAVYRGPSTGRHPMTREEIEISGSWQPRWRPSTKLKYRLRPVVDGAKRSRLP
jgi:nucleoid DNA-binding protein